MHAYLYNHRADIVTTLRRALAHQAYTLSAKATRAVLRHLDAVQDLYTKLPEPSQRLSAIEARNLHELAHQLRCAASLLGVQLNLH